jgi:16S rRNA C967 or C1407 C5-methylase (RsmB/RsmF family)
LYLDEIRLSSAKGREPSWEDRVTSYWNWKENGHVIESSLPDHLKGMLSPGLHERAAKPEQSAVVSHPLPLWNALVASHGKEKAFSIAQANNTQAPFTLRANLLKCTRDLAVTSLNDRGIPVELLKSPEAFNITKRVAIERDPAYLAGEIEVRDEALQILAATAASNGNLSQ